jgi:hypothetical protein
LLAVGSQNFLFLSAVAVFSAELFLVLYVWPRHHHHHYHRFHGFVVLQVVLECVLSSQVLLFVPGL